MPDPLLAQKFLIRYQWQGDEVQNWYHALSKFIMNVFNEIREDWANLDGGRSHARSDEIPR